jgi:hypothetical protein
VNDCLRKLREDLTRDLVDEEWAKILVSPQTLEDIQKWMVEPDDRTKGGVLTGKITWPSPGEEAKSI